ASIARRFPYTTLFRSTFNETPPEPRGYTIEQPARIALDLSGVSSTLASKYHQLGQGNTQSVTVADAGGRTRLVVNLQKLVPYQRSEEHPSELQSREKH